jgi:hypothetical protein
MSEFSIEKFKELATVHEPHCISIYIPTHRAGKEVNQKVDQLNLKNKMQKISRELENYYLKKRDIDIIMEPIKELVEDGGFWNLQSDGLAVFCSEGRFEYYKVPMRFDDFVYISDHFYLKPIIPYLNDDGKFYLLSLSQNNVKLYEGHPHHLSEIGIEDLVPENFQEVVGDDYKEKNLQFRTGHSGSENAVFHGHGSGKEEDKLEIQKYFRAINDGLMNVFNNRRRPLVLAAVDYLVPIYREVNHYQNLYHEFIPGNPEHEDTRVLHKKARAMLSDYFNQSRINTLALFEEALSSNKASYKEEDIIAAAYNQKIDTLFIRDHQVLWGVFNKEDGSVTLRDDNTQYKSCMINFAAVHTMLNSGHVYLMNADQLPENGSKMNAIYRY